MQITNGPFIAETWHEHKPDPLMCNAECAALGCVLINEKAIHQIIDVLGTDPGPFYFPHNRTVFQSYLKLWDQGIPIDVVLVIEDLRKSDEREPREGWPIFITELSAVVPTSANARAYAEAVLARHRLLEGVSAVKAVAKSNAPENELVPLADRIMELHKSENKRGLLSAKDITVGAIDRFESLIKQDGAHAVKTGYTRLDDILRGGTHNGDLVVVAARPSHGKTAFALNLALRAAQLSETHALIFSLEMSKDAILERFIAICANVNTSRLYSGFQADIELKKIRAAMPMFSKLPISLCDETNLTIEKIAHRAINFVERHKPCIIVVDYLQLIRAGGKFQSREIEVAHISKTLKGIARQTNVPVVVCCQLNRESETQTDPFKKLAYLRESGSIEQDADVVMILARNDDEKIKDENAMTICVAKHRNGPVGKTVLHFDRETQRIEQYSDLRKTGPNASSGYYWDDDQ